VPAKLELLNHDHDDHSAVPRRHRTRSYRLAEQPAARRRGPELGTAIGNAHIAERARIKAILACPEAVGREAVALVFAFESGMTPEAAAKALAAVPDARAPNHPAVAAGWDDVVAIVNKSVNVNAARAFGRRGAGPDTPDPASTWDAVISETHWATAARGRQGTKAA